MVGIGTRKNGIDTESAGARINEKRKQLVKTTASKVAGKKLIVCNIAVKWVGWESKRGK